MQKNFSHETSSKTYIVAIMEATLIWEAILKHVPK